MAGVVVVDYGLGNLGSIRNMLGRIGVEAQVSAAPEAIAAAERLILPGVGAFDHGMRRLGELGLIDPLERRVRVEGVPLLGICLGMQLLTRRSAEGQTAGLGWIEADTVAFRFPGGEPKVPHMGWNFVQPRGAGAGLLRGLEDEARFYFVHSYYVAPDDPANTLGVTQHGLPFASMVGEGQVYGVQFHPEKSHRFGRTLLENFLALERPA